LENGGSTRSQIAHTGLSTIRIYTPFIEFSHYASQFWRQTMAIDYRRLKEGRRSGADRRSGTDTRTEGEKQRVGERRSKIDRRSGLDRRTNIK
jgi:hypothetical protein